MAAAGINDGGGDDDDDDDGGGRRCFSWPQESFFLQLSTPHSLLVQEFLLLRIPHLGRPILTRIRKDFQAQIGQDALFLYYGCASISAAENHICRDSRYCKATAPPSCRGRCVFYTPEQDCTFAFHVQGLPSAHHPTLERSSAQTVLSSYSATLSWL